ncbi:MAG: hypothetical protein CO119_06840 [Flavobacteriales bacterium CG_4_9_14_3_um_filter_40_17]|nr:MAG: hypothetical protein CO119_06840 [Flavobacteriales bacterium CG_4_9_14_3_um_filter_40_17]
MLFKQPRSRRFNYIPKHIKENKSVLENDYEARLQEIKRLNRQRRKKQSTLSLLLVILALLIFIWYFLNSYEN